MKYSVVRQSACYEPVRYTPSIEREYVFRETVLATCGSMSNAIHIAASLSKTEPDNSENNEVFCFSVREESV
jgi:hypothetical protein